MKNKHDDDFDALLVLIGMLLLLLVFIGILHYLTIGGA